MDHLAPSSFPLLLAILAPAIAGCATLWLPRRITERRTWVSFLGPALAFVIILGHAISHGFEPVGEAVGTAPIHWMPSLHLNFTFLADGLGTFFGLLVSGVGVLIVLYARAYFGPDRDELYRFFPTLGFFTTAMLGTVLANSMLLTVLFWEMTSISSFLLIGWERYDSHSVKKAMQAFFTTGLGGVSMLGGVLLFGATTDVWTWSELLHRFAGHGGEALPIGGNVTWAYVLMGLGAATKSAQWPWHYWLPGAMVAPTPVSTFLHSATMVKAGVFLTARIFPVFMVLDIWPWLVLIPGAITMFLAALIALNQHDLKRIFAYTTVSQLGLLMCVYGLGSFSYTHGSGGAEADATQHALAAIDWDVSQIANHAFYKAPLFLLAGAITHVAGTRQLPELFGFVNKHRIMAILMILAGYALAGGPGTISFPAKELFFYAVYHVFEVHWIFKILAILAVLTAMCNVAIFMRLLTTLMGWHFGLRPTADEAHPDDADAHHHDVHDSKLWVIMLWAPAALLIGFQYLGGLVPPLWNAVFAPLETNMQYAAFAGGLPFVWQLHWGIPLIMSLCAFALGITLGLSPLMRGAVVDPHDRIYPAMYWMSVTGGGYAFRTVQTGHFRHYVTLVLVALLIGFAGSLYVDPEMVRVDLSTMFEFWPGVLLGIIVCATAIMMPMVEARVIRVLVLGACGFSVVGMYLLLQAPDLALTQVMFELISVILFVLVLRMLPTPDRKKRPNRLVRLTIGATVGIVVGWMTLLATQAPSNRVLGPFFDAHSHHGTELTDGRGGGGDNVVNVVLVDFRGFDTLGEITVLALAALAVWSLLPRLRKAVNNIGDRDGGGGGQPAFGSVPVRDPDHEEATP